MGTTRSRGRGKPRTRTGAHLGGRPPGKLLPVRVSISLEPELLEVLEAEAKREERSLSGFIRRLCRDAMGGRVRDLASAQAHMRRSAGKKRA